MSDPASESADPQPEDSTTPPAKASAPAKPQRSPTERLIVWGGIAVLVVLIGVQARARLGYERTLSTIEQRLAEDDSSNPRPLPLREVSEIVVGWPSQRTLDGEKHQQEVLNLSWRGLLSAYEINLHYDSTEKEPMILRIDTKDAPVKTRPIPGPAGEGDPDPMSMPDMSRDPSQTPGPGTSDPDAVDTESTEPPTEPDLPTTTDDPDSDTDTPPVPPSAEPSSEPEAGDEEQDTDDSDEDSDSDAPPPDSE